MARRMPQWGSVYRLVGLMLGLVVWLEGCAIPQLKAEDRLFLPVVAEVLDVYNLPAQDFQGTTVGGLSALVYDRPSDRFYALSDDRGRYGPARVYQLSMTLGPDGDGQPRFSNVAVVDVTTFKAESGEVYPQGQLDPEGLALSPRNTLLMSSEGDINRGVLPLLGEFDRNTGTLITTFRIPERFLPDDSDPPTQGVRNNLSFEALAINAAPGTAGQTEPFRLFTATESALVQDYEADPALPCTAAFCII